jgi:cysteine synthase
LLFHIQLVPLHHGVDQYNNPFNADAYYATLGPEIWKQSGGAVTHFVAGGSTGGTVSGTAKYLKEANPEVKAVMADPDGSVFWDHFVNGVPEVGLYKLNPIDP